MSHRSRDAINAEIERRIAEMEAPGYVFPRRFGRRDWIVWGIVALLCLALVVAGARL